MKEWLTLQLTKFATWLMSKRAMTEPVEEEEVRCPVCGEEWEKDEIFCYFCGYEQSDEKNPLHPPPTREGVIVDPDGFLETDSISSISERIEKIGNEKNIDLAVLLLSDQLRSELEHRMDNADGVVDITRSMEGLSYAIYNDWLMGKDTGMKGLLVVIDPKGENRVLVQGRKGPGLTDSRFRSWFENFEIGAGDDNRSAVLKELDLIATNLESI